MTKLKYLSLILTLTATYVFAYESRKEPTRREKQVIIQNCNSNAIAKPPKVIIKYVKSKPKTVVKIKKVRVVVEKKVERKILRNKVKLFGGYGRNGIAVTQTGKTGIVESVNGGIVGIGYERVLNNRISIGINVLSNKTYLLETGLSF